MQTLGDKKGYVASVIICVCVCVRAWSTGVGIRAMK
jgi:hypothetical protein